MIHFKRVFFFGQERKFSGKYADIFFGEISLSKDLVPTSFCSKKNPPNP